MDMCCLPKFDIYQGTVAPNSFKRHTNSDVLFFSKKKALPDPRSEIHLVRRYIVSTGQYALVQNKICSGL